MFQGNFRKRLSCLQLSALRAREGAQGSGGTLPAAVQLEHRGRPRGGRHLLLREDDNVPSITASTYNSPPPPLRLLHPSGCRWHCTCLVWQGVELLLDHLSKGRWWLLFGVAFFFFYVSSGRVIFIKSRHLCYSQCLYPLPYKSNRNSLS